MIVALLGLLGGVMLAAFVLAPLGRDQPAGAPAAPAGDPLLDRREAALAGLVELDFDHSLGNLSAADYEHLRAHYRGEAIAVLREIGAAPSGAAEPAPDAVSSQPAPAPAPRSPLLPLAAAALLLLLLAGTAALLRPAGPAAADAAPLDVLHVHAALLVTGTDVALVGHHGGLLRSSDGGTNWAAVPAVAGEVLALAAAPVVGSEIYLAGAAGIMRSRDAGLSWDLLPPPPAAPAVAALAIAANGAPPLYAYAPGAGLFRSDDLVSWRLAGGALPVEIAALQLRSGSLGALYAASPTDGVLASGDGGLNWGSASGALNGVLPTLAVRALADDPASGEQFAAPDGTMLSGTLYAGTDLGLFKSGDGGGSWAPLPLQQPLAAIAARQLPSPLLLAIDSRSRVWRSSDRGGSWRAGP